jgi:hypothetical protein
MTGVQELFCHAEPRRPRRNANRERADLDDIREAIIDSAIRVHRDLGPGLLESVYKAVLAHALEKRGFHVERQMPVRFKSDERLAPVYGKKLLTSLRLTKKRVGLLLKFGANTLTKGLRRVVNNLPPSASPRLRVNHAVPQCPQS